MLDLTVGCPKYLFNTRSRAEPVQYICIFFPEFLFETKKEQFYLKESMKVGLAFLVEQSDINRLNASYNGSNSLFPICYWCQITKEQRKCRDLPRCLQVASQMKSREVIPHRKNWSPYRRTATCTRIKVIMHKLRGS